MGLHVSIYRQAGSSYDCTAGGISSRAARLCLVNLDGPDSPADDAPPAMLVPHTPFGDDVGRRLVRIVPAQQIAGAWVPLDGWVNEDTGRKWYWPMFGGNFAASSDSRFRGAIEQLLGAFFHGAVAIHDRFES